MMVGVDNALNLYRTLLWELKSEGNLLFFLASQWVRLLARFSRVGLTSGLVRSRPLLSAPYGGRCVRLFQWCCACWDGSENGTTELITTLTLLPVQGFGVVQALITFSSMLADIADGRELALQAPRGYFHHGFAPTKSLQVLVRW